MEWNGMECLCVYVCIHACMHHMCIYATLRLQVMCVDLKFSHGAQSRFLSLGCNSRDAFFGDSGVTWQVVGEDHIGGSHADQGKNRVIYTLHNQPLV